MWGSDYLGVKGRISGPDGQHYANHTSEQSPRPHRGTVHGPWGSAKLPSQAPSAQGQVRPSNTSQAGERPCGGLGAACLLPASAC